MSSPQHPDGEAGGHRRLEHGHRAERQGVPEHRSPLPSGVVSSRSRVPLVRSRRVDDARDDEHDDEREDAEQRRADPVEDVAGQVGVDPREQAEQHARHHDHQGDGAVVGAQLAQDAARGGEGDPEVHAACTAAAPPSAASAASMRRGRPARHRRCRCARAARGSVESAEDAPVAQQQQPVAARGLVHDVARHEHGAPLAGEPAEQVPQLAAEHGVEPDRRLVEHEHLGVAHQRAGEASPRLAARPRGSRPELRRGRSRSTAAMARSTASAPTPMIRGDVARRCRAPRGRRRRSAPG